MPRASIVRSMRPHIAVTVEILGYAWRLQVVEEIDSINVFNSVRAYKSNLHWRSACVSGPWATGVLMTSLPRLALPLRRPNV